jgi:EmrB/QacA subfamily drug resistance transporter
MQQKDVSIKITLAIMMVASFITPFMGNAISLAIPAIGKEFGANQFLLNWIVFSYLMTSTIFLLPFGRVADRYGRKKVFLSGMIIFALASLACALSTTLSFLIFFRAVQGLGSSMVFGTAIAIVSSVVPPETRGRAIGMNTAAVYIGLSAGPVLGGFITSAFSWRGIFYFNLALAIIVIVATLWKLRSEWKGEQVKFDFVGGTLYVLGLALLLYGLSDLISNFTNLICFFIGMIILIIFILREVKARFPLVPISLFTKNRAFAFSNLAALINYSATFALVYVLSLYLQTVMGLGTTESGFILLAQPIVMAVFSPLAGLVSDWVKPRLIASIGMGMTALGLLFFIFLGTGTPKFLIVINLAFIGLGFAMFSSPNTNAVMGSVEQKFYGLASSTLGTMRMLGQSFSITIVALVTSVFMRDLTIDSVDYSSNLMFSIKVLFGIFTVLCIAGVFSSLARGSKSEEV